MAAVTVCAITRPGLAAAPPGRSGSVLLIAVCLLSAVLAYAQLGVWAGVFAALTALMTGLVALPYLDAWWHAGREKRHVG